jgi:HK97 family phage major capsid protein
MAKEKDAMNEVMGAVAEIRALAESKNADTAEVKSKQEKFEKLAGDKFAEAQKATLLAEEKANKLRSVVDAVKKDYDELYKKSNRFGAGSEDQLAKSAYHKELSNYIRKGALPGSDSINEIAQLYVEKAMDVEDKRAADHAVHNMIDEQGPESGKGFYLMNDLKTMRVGNNPDGGYATVSDRRTDITVDRIFETSPMRAIANVVTTGNSEIEIPIDDNESTSGGWVGEEGTISTTAQAQLGMLKIAIHEQFAEPKATQKMLDDSFFDIEAWLASKTDDILTRDENTAFVTGNGSLKPKGIMSYDAWTTAGTYERGKIEQVNSGAAGIVKADGLITLQNSLLEAYQGNAKFLMKRTTFGAVSKLKDGNGTYLLNSMMLPQGASMTLLGKPVIFADDIAAIASNALAIAYGDFSRAYTIVDRMGIRVLRDPLTAKPYIKFYTTKRVGGAVTNYQAVKIQKLAV